jgi:YVTN family beta-propeller protein
MRFHLPLLFLGFAVASGGGCASSNAEDEPVEAGVDALDSFRSTPSELRGTTVHFLRRHRRPLEPTVDHRLSIGVELPNPLRSRVESLVLRAPGGAVVLDCDAQRGTWGNELGADDRYCTIDVAEGQTGNGVYRLDIKLTGRLAFSGAFAVARAWSSSDVRVDGPVNLPFSSPLVETDARPPLAWHDFRSPQLDAAREARAIEVFVTAEHQDVGEEFRQRLASGTTRAQLTRDLHDGEHRLSVTYKESRTTGPLVVSREAETLVRFFSRRAATAVPVFAVAEFSTNRIDFIDPQGTILANVDAGGDGPHGIAFGEGTFVMANTRDNSVSFLDRRGAVTRPPIHIGSFTESMAYGGGVFALTNGDLSIVDKNGGLVRAPVGLGNGPIAAGFGDGVFVVADFGRGSATIVDPGGKILARDIPVGKEPRGVAFGDGVFVVTASGDNAVAVLRKDGTVVTSSIPVGRSPRGVAFGDGVFVVANADDDSVSIIDKQGKVVPDVRVGKTPKGVAFGGGVFAVTNPAGESVSLVDKRGVVRKTVSLAVPGRQVQPIAVTFGEILR